MEEIKAPKKERKFLKAMGDIALTLFRELLLGVGKKVINKIGNKRQGLAIAFVMVAGISYASIDSIPFPITGNKQRLGWQTTGNGLVYRGTAADTVTKPSNYTNKDIKAYLLVDTVNNVMYSYIASKGGWQFNNSDTVIINNNFAQPVDSLFFKTSVATNNVDTAKMRWDSELATVVLGMYDQVPNELGFKNFWLVKNQTGSTITKNSIVYANGTVGASGRITVAKFIANGTIESKYVLGITAHDLTDGEDGYVISYGKIRQVNTDTFAAGAILYPSPTTAGVWTDVEPVAPNIDMPIGFCINSSVNNGTIAIKVESGFKLHELHDVAITSPVDKASLYYTNGLWRDTTAAILAGDLKTVNSNNLVGSGNISVGTVTSVGGTGTVNGITLTGTVTSSGNLTLGGTLSGVSLSSQVSGTLPIANGGTNAATISQARTNLQVPNIATTITPQAPLTGGGSLAGDRTISIPVATSVANGYLSSTDWSTFNGKQNAITLTTTGTSGAATLTGATLNIPQYAGGSGTVTNITVTSPLTITNPTTTPLIQINAANGTSSAGVVTTGTQQFGGAKTFNGNLTTNGNMKVDGTLNVDLGSTFASTIILNSVSGTAATSVIGRSSTGQVVGVTLGSGLNLSSGTLNIGSFTLASLDFPSTSAQTSSDLTVSYTGAQTSHPVMLAVPDGSAPDNTNYTAWVSATGTVKVRFNNYSSASVNPASGTFTIFVLNL